MSNYGGVWADVGKRMVEALLEVKARDDKLIASMHSNGLKSNNLLASNASKTDDKPL